jgi:hypothetical protein
MTKVIVSEDCGNSPKNIFLKEMTAAFAKGDVKYLLAHVTEDIHWNILSYGSIKGKNDFADALKQMKTIKVRSVTIHHIATHGKSGFVNGTTQLEDGKTSTFCDVYEFSNAKGSAVKEITSYVIALE